MPFLGIRNGITQLNVLEPEIGSVFQESCGSPYVIGLCYPGSARLGIGCTFTGPVFIVIPLGNIESAVESFYIIIYLREDLLSECSLEKL